MALEAAQGQIVGVVKALLGTQAEQAATLARIEAKVDALAMAPMNTGRIQLVEAFDDGRSPEDSRARLHDARRNFQDALGYSLAPQLWVSFIQLHLCVTYVALGDLADARRALSGSHVASARAALEVHDSPFSRPHLVRSDLMPFVNELGRARRNWGDSGQASPIFVGVPAETPTDDVDLGDWRTWANGYANIGPEHRARRRESTLQQARRAGVRELDELRACMDEVDAGRQVHVRFIDDWVDAQV